MYILNIVTPTFERNAELELLKLSIVESIRYLINSQSFAINEINILWTIINDGDTRFCFENDIPFNVRKLLYIQFFNAEQNLGKVKVIQHFCNQFYESDYIVILDSDDLIPVEGIFNILVNICNHKYNFYSFRSNISKNQKEPVMDKYVNFRWNNNNMEDRCDICNSKKYIKVLESIHIRNNVLYPEALLYFKLFQGEMVFFSNEEVLTKIYTKSGYTGKRVIWKIKSYEYFFRYYFILLNHEELAIVKRIQYGFRLTIFILLLPIHLIWRSRGNFDNTFHKNIFIPWLNEKAK